MPTSPAFRRSAEAFANELSGALTGTITFTPLRCEILEGTNVAYLRFRRPSSDTELRFVELENGCWISIYQRLVPNEDDPRRVHAAEHSYSYSLSPNVDKDWLIRYDYEPEKRRAQESDNEDAGGGPYPVSHVHVNAHNEAYDEFIKSIKDKYTPLSDIHFPTARVSLEAFIRHLIVEFRVPLLHGKSKRQALQLLEEAERKFAMNRTDQREV